jgi:NAD dependent epimerase/dehydratase family enzyme
VIHRPYWFPTPSFILKLLLGEMSTLVLDGQRVLPHRLLDAGFDFRYPELKSALVEIFQK